MMGSKHKVVHSEHGREKRRKKGDIALALMLFFAILAVLLGHGIWDMERSEKVDDRETYAAVFRKEETLRVREEALRRAEIVALSEAAQGNSASSSFPQWEESLLAEGDTEVDEPTAIDNQGTSAATLIEVGPSFVRFDDVTATTYENKRLGFIMELPTEWKMVNEDSDGIILASSPLGVGEKLADIAQKEGALWIAVSRPCESQEGVTTQFAFASTTAAVTREATACIAPFLVTLGYRADAPDRVGRERFLLSIARTFYPIVSPYAPYSPISR